MRADRLVSMILLLRRRGQMSASELAGELEVSTRTVLRDIEALSGAGVPVYAERGRNGGFALLPGFRTELTGLSDDEALALVLAASRGGVALGLGSALASAVLKVTDALPETHRAGVEAASERVLVDPVEGFVSRRRSAATAPDGDAVAVVRRAVLAGLKLRIHYAAAGEEPRWRTVDPVGLVDSHGIDYLLAARDGEQRTYRLSRVVEAEIVEEPAERPARVDLAREWQGRVRAFSPGRDQFQVTVRAHGDERSLLTPMRRRGPDDALGGELVTMSFADARQAEHALWAMGAEVEVVAPDWLRAAMATRARSVAARYEPAPTRDASEER